jgi:Rrf2 family transcriptional regulator, iron-sulfur cluster assembly transcription factor
VLRLSNRGRYAVRAVFDLAFRGSAGRPAQVRDVAERQHIPLRFLEQIFQELKRAGLVESKRGPHGGFRLARSPDDVRLGDVLRAVEGPVALAPQARVRRRTAQPVPPVDLPDIADAFLVDVGRSVERCFDDVTLGHLCARGDELGLRGGERTPSTSPPRWTI